MVELGGTDGEYFGFPYAHPYDVQLQFMRCLYKVIQDRGIGIFQSPTGTGKSLSLLCGSFRWLRDESAKHSSPPLTATPIQQQQNFTDSISTGGNDEPAEPDWVVEHQRRKQEAEIQRLLASKLEQQRQLDERIAAIRAQEYSWESEQQKSKIRRSMDDDLVMSEYESDGGYETSDADHQRKRQLEDLRRQFTAVPNRRSTAETFGALQQRNDDDDNFNNPSANDEICDRQKIIIASRTHSQLSQLVAELKKTGYAANAKVISLGSRRQMCINSEVQSLRSAQRMNDKCKDLLATAAGCPYYNGPYYNGPNGGSDNRERKEHFYDFADRSLAKVQDIEELVISGRQRKTCPYYGSRYAIAQAELVTVPYSILLNPSARQSLGLSIKDNVVIIDEAHNLIDAINQLNNAHLSITQIERCQTSLRAYLQKYQARLSGRNIVYIKQILVCLQRFQRHLNTISSPSSNSTVIPIAEFAHTVKIDHLNLFKLCSFLEQSDIHRKIMGFVAAETVLPGDNLMNDGSDKTDDVYQSRHISPLQPVNQFLNCLTNPDKNGRIVVSKDCFEFMLLNPATYFEDIVQQVHSVILAGGTMDPLDDFRAQLFPSPDLVDRIQEFSCGHVIPSDQLQMLILPRSRPAGPEYTMTFDKRHDRQLLLDIGESLILMCSVVPDGVVVFFSSYGYLESVLKVWEEDLSGRHIMERLRSLKAIFNEPRESQPGALESMLNRYQQSINRASSAADGKEEKQQTGALLFAVVGGKLSEGINFSDGLGRLIVMIGMPYPNSQSPEIRERMRYAELHKQQRGGGAGGGQEFYQNVCMRAVNQSIGRAIRHQRDYASVVLVDSRYGGDKIRQKLPQWMQPSIKQCSSVNDVVSELCDFFQNAPVG